MKLRDLNISSSLCSWILDLTDRPQAVRMGNIISSTLTLNWCPAGMCVKPPTRCALMGHDCMATHTSNIIIKFADDITITGCITSDDESAYRAEVATLTSWCQDNSLLYNISKTKELIVDYRRLQEEEHTPIFIGGRTVESQLLQIPWN
ncbi:hypothetical protein AALO_G00291400 [Alosa alosa]|uniref:Reverse transcriptase domain-containing protein n=1 Tax=Alosa alosa TaxID=278164 RepID=A0AAV6FGW1_9TELE|nr:hypothetical protein AALO_G00291400 [Alosa alosa]